MHKIRKITNSAFAFLFIFSFLIFFFALNYVRAEKMMETTDSKGDDALLSPEAFGQVPLNGRDIFLFEEKPGLSDGWLDLPFASDKKIDRACFDADVKLNISTFETPLLGITVENPKAVGNMTLYFRSGAGWYGMGGKASGPIEPNRPVQIVFSLSEANTEGKPAGLDKIDGIRIAFWRGNDIDSRVRLDSLKVQEHNFISVVADPEKRDGDAGHGPDQSRQLARLGVPTTQITASDLALERIASARAVILPITAALTDEQVGVLCDYVDQGGFVVLCYTQPARLMNRLGFTSGTYTKPKADEPKLSEIHFLPGREKSPGLTVIAREVHNAAIAHPLPDAELPERLKSDAAKPQIDALWQDSDGNMTDLPAIVSSGSGIFWSHLFPSNDAATRRYIGSVFGALDPTIPRVAARKAWGELFSVGYDPTTIDDTDAFREKALEEILPRLAQEGWSESQIKAILFDQSEVVSCERFIAAVETVRQERTEAFCASFESKPVEARLWWQHSGLGPYPGDWDRAMKELSEAGFNAVIPNMLWGGSAMYESDILPRAPEVDKYGDQVAQAVAAGKKYGVGVHIWKVNWNCGRTPQSFIDEMTAAGRMQKSFNGEIKPWLCPSHPLNQKLEADSMLEVATKYDVDGIHFDYIRYDGAEFCYCDGCRERFSAFYQQRTGKELADWPESTRRDEKVQELWSQWRRDQITALVRQVRRRVDLECPDCQVSAAVFSDYPGCTKGIGQDWLAWVHEGLLDFICPMDYTSFPVRFDSLIKRQNELIGGKIPLYPGIGATSTGNSLSSDQVAIQIDIARRNDCAGFTIFNLSQREAAKYFPALSSGPTKTKSSFSEAEPGKRTITNSGANTDGIRTVCKPFAADQRFTAVHQVVTATEARDLTALEFPTQSFTLKDTDGNPIPPQNLKALSTAGLTAIDGHPGSYAFLALVDPSSNRGVVAGWLTNRVGSGLLFSGVNDAGDVTLTPRIEYGRRPLAANETFVSETLLIGEFDDARIGLEAYADALAVANGVKIKPPKTGYCTWYSNEYGGAGDENSTAEFARIAKEKLVPYGMDFFQIDDKWQLGNSKNGPNKNFTDVRPDGPYKSGLKKTVETLSDAGLLCGLWYMPFSGNFDDPWFADKQDLFVRSAINYPAPGEKNTRTYSSINQTKGAPYETFWGGTCLDATNPKTLAYIEELTRRIAHEWNVGYFKVDGLWTGMAIEQLYVNDGYKPDDLGQQIFYDPAKTNIEAYCAGCDAVRCAAGDDVFILGCNVSQNMRMMLPSVGFVDAMRIGPDNGANWEGICAGPWRASNRYFLNGRVWWNDPDPVYVRDWIPLTHARVITSWAALTGQLYAFSDWLPSLSDERVNILRKTIPTHGLTSARPVDLFTSEMARVWTLTFNAPNAKPEEVRTVVGLFNWNENEAAEFSLSPEKLDLVRETSDGKNITEYAVYDFWEEKFRENFGLGLPNGDLTLTVPPASCMMLAIRPMLKRPTLLSTSRNITQGIYEVVSEDWNAKEKTLTIAVDPKKAALVEELPYVLRLIAPEGFFVEKLTIADSAGDELSVNHATLTETSAGRTEAEVPLLSNISDLKRIFVAATVSGHMETTAAFEPFAAESLPKNGDPVRFVFQFMDNPTKR